MNEMDYWDNIDYENQRLARDIVRKAIEKTEEYRMAGNDGYTEVGVSAYRCIAYKPEIGAEVTEKWIIAPGQDAARDLFAAELGAEKIKEGWTIQVFRGA
jgi:hypothetical protein